MYRSIFNVINFLSVMVLSLFFILILNCYYQVQSYVSSIYDDLSIVVFFKENVKNIDQLSEKIKNVETLYIKELVDSKQAYLKALEKNPFLKDIVTSNTIMSIGSYVVIRPKKNFDENYLLKIRNDVESIDDVDEVVFDSYSFNQYRIIKKILKSCKKIFFYIFFVFVVLFVVKVIGPIYFQEVGLKKIIQKCCFYIIAASISFVVAWGLSIFFQYDLSIDKSLILFVVPFVSILGLVLENQL